jgi:ADP-ribose pyrophosphatase
VCENQHFEVFFDTVRATDATMIEDFLIVRPRVCAADKVAGVCILPEVNGKLGLMRVFRHHLGEEVWQAPGGFIEPDEEAAAAAVRELKEETGVVPSRVQSLGNYLPDAGLIEGRVALFLGRGCTVCDEGASSPSEIGAGQLHWFEPEALRGLILSQCNIGGSTLAACFRALSQ